MVKRKGALEAPKQAHTTSDYEKYSEALRELHRQYYASVKSCAEDLVGRARKGELKGADAFEQAVSEAVDGSEWVTYMHQARVACLVSDNEDAIFEDGVEVACDGSVPYSQMAYYAMSHDVYDAVEALGFRYYTDEEADEADDDEADEEG